MAKKNPIAKQFKKFLVDLYAERHRLEQGLAHIMEVISTAGLDLSKKIGRGRKPKAVKAVKEAKKPGRKAGRRRKRFDLTAEQFVLKMVTDAGQLTTAQVNEAWKKAGRKGLANNALGKLVKEKKLSKTENVGGRGSVYKVM